LCVTEVYAAGETAIPGADGRAHLPRGAQPRQLEPLFVEKVEELASAQDVIRDGRRHRSIGRGHISAVAQRLPAGTHGPAARRGAS